MLDRRRRRDVYVPLIAIDGDPERDGLPLRHSAAVADDLDWPPAPLIHTRGFI